MFAKIFIHLIVLTFLTTFCYGEDYINTPYNSSSGLYYEKVGTVLLSNDNWQFVTSIDYKGYLLFYEYLKHQSSKFEEFCYHHAYNYCHERLANIKTALGRIEETDDIMATFLGIRAKSKRKRRFWSEIGSFFQGLGNGIAAVASVFVGGSSQPDMSYYDQQISEFRKGQSEIVDRINKQTTLFMVDAEKKNVEINWLKNTQSDILNKLQTLQSNMTADSIEKTKKLNEFNILLKETNKKLEEQAKLQEKLSERVGAIEVKLSGVEKKLTNLLDTVTKHDKILNETNLKVEVNSLTLDLKFIFDQFENEQSKLFYVLKRAKRGELDPYVLSPINLVKMLQNIIPKIQDTERFPFYPNIENAHHLYNLITPDVYFHNYTLIFILKIPIVNIKSFNFYKITSLPFPAKPKVFAFLLPKDPFLIIDKNAQEYSTMSQDQYTTFCKPIGNIFLCKHYQPLSSVHYEPICEVTLLMSSRTIPNSCNKRLMYLNDVLFLQLQKPNSWVYLSPEISSVIIICNSNRHEVLIEGSGFITLSANSCEMKYKIFKIENIIEFSKPVEMNYTSSANLMNFIARSDVDNIQPKFGNKQQMLILPFEFDVLSENSFPVENNNSTINYLYLLLLIPFVLPLIVLLVFHKKVKLFVMKLAKKNTAYRDTNMTARYNTEGQDKLKLKRNTINQTDKIATLSTKGTPTETDLDGEYITVRVKVKNTLKNKMSSMMKRNNRSKIANEYIATAPPIAEPPQNGTSLDFNKIDDIDEDEVYGNHGVIFQENYLNELRKMKPKK